MFSTESQSSRQKHPIQGGGQIHFLPTCRRAWAVLPGDRNGAQSAGGVVHLPEPSPQSQAGSLLASLWPGWALLILALQGAKKDMGAGTGQANALLPFCRQRESLLDDYSCTEWKSKILYFKSNFSYEILICNCLSPSPALYGANKCLQAFMIVISLYEREKVFPSMPASSVKGG